MIKKILASGVLWVKLNDIYRKLPSEILAYYVCTYNDNHGYSETEPHKEDLKRNSNAEKRKSMENVGMCSNDIDQLPEEPTTCCMSGCANCVWLEYADKMSEYFKDGGESAIKEINEKVNDPNIKAFLLLELRMRKF